MPPRKYNYRSLYNIYRDGYRHNRKYTYNKNPRGCTKQLEELISDRTRILYSAAFRRLQQKAQVFSMETNSNVRSRLTHSLEVSDLGRRLSNGITGKLRAAKLMKPDEMPVVAAIVENSCLMHDIGNPPFGHFGESAIQDWAKYKAMEVTPADWTTLDEEGNLVWAEPMDKLMADFMEFDGNPQGFRVVTRLLDKGGLCLTAASLLCALKYARPAGEAGDDGIRKKAGWFRSEQRLVERIHGECGRELGTRYPLTYIMEAADDISYCMSDIADSIEKRIITEEEFILSFCEQWEKVNAKAAAKGLPAMPLPVEITRFYTGKNWTKRKMRGFNRDFAIDWARRATDEVVKNYMDHEEAIYAGVAEPLTAHDGEMARVLKTIGKVCVEKIYPSLEAECIELTGYAVISGIIHHYERLLVMTHEDFKLAAGPGRKDFPVEARLFNRLSRDCVEAYNAAVNALDPGDGAFAQKEWWLRVHLLIDHISSMTDAFAMETYQMLEGIALMRT